MSSWVFSPPSPPSVAVFESTARFPVRRIFCVGRNYAAHAKEMGADPTREPPFFFMKPPDAVLDADSSDGAVVPYPPLTSNLHYEVELVVALSSGGANVPAAAAHELIFGYAVGLDLTRRDLQFAARDAGKPWDWGKGFDFSAPVGRIHPVSRFGHPAQQRIWLELDGQRKQDATVAELTWSVPEVLAAISQSVRLEAGDLIFTGTPSGVGPIARGQRVHGHVDGLSDVVIRVS